ncbi:MAG: bifunctional phosphopantothenoylcysteine decarboxylase/phosphopantothenate--cysteine ligase CoaBC [Chloroflexi bacterium]|nr:bifunctional phosphopantothenoylcysteine decarboxylase/phosphopantothenate--cysteine ligase CoaBC [Chloroflexota bacterium]
MLNNKVVVLGVAGSIAAYKGADLASKLVQAGAQVDVILTKAATEFITLLTFRSITHRPAVVDMFDPYAEEGLQHLAWARRADAVVIAPATANIIAKLAAGIADDMLTTTILATPAPVILAPAMDTGMYENSVTQENLGRLRSRGIVVVEPAYGRLASGIMGLGRLAPVENILGAISQILGQRGDLAGKEIVVSAGGTQEPIDPARHIGNPSSGKMGYAIAEAARDRGASVTLVCGPTSLSPLVGVKWVPVRTALEMRDAIITEAAETDALVMAAAVADYRPAVAAPNKIKKGASSLTIELVKNPDILAEYQGKAIKVGFAAESEDFIENARKKLAAKGLDFIVVNDITAPDSGFAVDTNRVTIIDRDGGVESLPLMLKTELADKILDRIAALLAQR